MENKNQQEREDFIEQNEKLHDNYQMEREKIEEEMQRIIDEKQHVIDKLTEGTKRMKAELKAMKETCMCKAKVGETPVSKRTRSQKP